MKNMNFFRYFCTISKTREATTEFVLFFVAPIFGYVFRLKLIEIEINSAYELFSDVWIYMATAYLGVSVLLFILARFTPYEWSTGQHPDKFETQFTLMNCMWFGKTNEPTS